MFYLKMALGVYMAWKGVTGDERMYYSYFDGNNWAQQQFAVGMTSVGHHYHYSLIQ